ncbi:MCE family protein [Aeromicrobium alkaliterrae]|uniref:MCE family protein n=1 Tax=Aeromicrobium alkaliterrae TaxID=302168 RepID=A0ABP4WFL3_9ACTN
MRLDREAFSAMIKVGLFLAFTGIVTYLLMSILANGLFRDDHQYKAIFTDVTGVSKGDDVRIAGVSVGKVTSIKVYERDKAVVTFGVDADRPLTQNTHATLKFRNLVGQRYLALSQDPSGSSAVLKPGSTIPDAQTTDALDLNVLLNGFKPVFEALSPDDTNQFAFEIIQVLQGESGSVQSLLATTASLTNTLADRDQLIGDVITNLSTTLDIVADRDAQLDQTIVTLQQFVSGLNGDREAILGSIDSISLLANETAKFLDEGAPALAADVTALKDLTSTLTAGDNLGELERNLQITPIKMKKLSNAASAGSQFNFYVCGLNLTLQGTPLNLPDIGGDRCQRDAIPGGE